jgi:hypothetical protein
MPGSVRPQSRGQLVHVDRCCRICDVSRAVLMVGAHPALKNIERAHARVNIAQLPVMLAAVMQLFDIARSKRDREFTLASTISY